MYIYIIIVPCIHIYRESGGETYTFVNTYIYIYIHALHVLDSGFARSS